MGRLTPLALVVVVALCLFAGSARAGLEPLRIVGADYAVSAAHATAAASFSVRSAATLDPGTPTRILVRLAVKRKGSPGRRIDVEGLTWKVDYREPRTTVTIALRVLHSADPACPVGTLGSFVLRDDDTRLPSGRSSDRVRLRFAGGSCREFARVYTNAAAGQKARVEVELDLETPS